MKKLPPLVLTEKNYHSLDADRLYMSSHQFGAWDECPAREFCRLQGNHEGELAEIFSEEKEALVMGSYVDLALTEPDKLDAFIKSAPEWWFKKERATKANPNPGHTGDPTARKEKCDQMIARAKRDQLFMNTLAGTPQRIITWEMFGCWWKMKADVLDEHPETFTATDLKTTKSIAATDWSKEFKIHVPFYESYNYWRQFAIYRAGIESEYKRAPDYFFMSAVSKEKYPDIDVFVFDDPERFTQELSRIEDKMVQVLAYKRGELVPPRCEDCDYCHVTKVLKDVKRAKNFRRASEI